MIQRYPLIGHVSEKCVNSILSVSLTASIDSSLILSEKEKEVYDYMRF